MTPQIDHNLAQRIAAGWSYDGRKIVKTFTFPDFTAAFAFMSACAPGIEKRNHHPEWSNVYNKVTVALTTHDTGGVTAKDHELAMMMDGIFAARKSPAHQ